MPKITELEVAEAGFKPEWSGRGVRDSYHQAGLQLGRVKASSSLVLPCGVLPECVQYPVLQNALRKCEKYKNKIRNESMESIKENKPRAR